MQLVSRSLLAASLILSVAGIPAHADKPDRAGGKGKGQGQGQAPGQDGKSHGDSRHHDDDDDIEIHFSSNAHDLYRSWYDEHYGRGHCPPGLAKKHNGCLPPGLAKKRYAIGAPLPGGIVLQALPGDLATRLGPPPHGYRYGVIDGDVVKLSLGTLLVVDALSGLLQ